MAKHRIPYERLLAYAAGELSGNEAAEVQAALASDSELAATVERLCTVIPLMRTDDSQDAPPETITAAKALFRAPRGLERPSWLEQLRRIVGALTFDSRPQVALAGLRGRSDTYQLTYESAPADVELEVAVDSTDRAHRCVRGQVSAHGEVGADAVALTAAGTLKPLALAIPDAHGVFRLVIPPGRFDLFVSLRESMVVLSNVEIE